MMPLRDMKKHWTLQEFTAMDSTFNFNIKAGGKASCKGVSLDMNECNSFQSYLREGEFQYGRYGFLYGGFGEGDKVRVDFVYEPTQGIGRGGFEMIEGSEEEEEKVEELARSLGVTKVMAWRRAGRRAGAKRQHNAYRNISTRRYALCINITNNP